jgi:uncharacterized protein (TIGR03118 family)
MRRFAMIPTGTFALIVFAHAAEARTGNNYDVTVQVSNERGVAPITDPLLVNPWGIAASATSSWWAADNGADEATLYTGAGAKLSLEVAVPGGPTGIVSNPTTSFEVAPQHPGRFIFAAEDGTFSAWNPQVDPTHALTVFTDEGAVFKGLAIHGTTLYAANFAGCKVEVVDGRFQAIESAGGFEDETIPADYCPFGIQAIGDSIFVTYALSDGTEDVAGQGHGFVREFDADGNLLSLVGDHGQLNSPWGLAMAPAGFGAFGGCLLVGNNGDGRINAFCKDDEGQLHPSGQLRQAHGDLVIDGLWGIGFGNGAASGPTDVLYFAAGPDADANGLFGRIAAQP